MKVARVWPALVAGAFGLLWFFFIGAGATLNPMNTSWVYEGDSGIHQLGWLFFRDEPWSFPLGRITRFLYPLGTTVGWTDSIPWVCFVLKVFSSILPAEFQFLGPWVGLAFIAQGVVGAWVTSRLTDSKAAQAGVGALFVTAPFLAHRFDHESLCAQWVILIPLGLLLTPAKDRSHARKMMLVCLALVIAAAGIHAYLWAMLMTFVMALVARLTLIERRLAPVEAALWGLGNAAVSGTLLALFGFFTRTTTSAWGFGFYSAGLLTLINPAGTSWIVPSFRQADGGHEGFAYLGLGVLLLLVVSSVLTVVLRNKQRGPLFATSTLPFWFTCITLAIFSLSNHVKLGDRVVVDLTALYRPLSAITGPFRSSGRFIWPLHYGLLVLAIALWVRLFRDKNKTMLAGIFCALTIQLIDLVGLYNLHPIPPGTETDLSANARIKDTFDRMALVPPPIFYGGTPLCSTSMASLMILAGRAAALGGLTFNSGHVARLPSDGSALTLCHADARRLSRDAPDPRTLYVVQTGLLPELSKAQNIRCVPGPKVGLCAASSVDPKILVQATF